MLWTILELNGTLHHQFFFLAVVNNNFQKVKFKIYLNEIWHASITNTVKSASQISGEILNSYWFIGHLMCMATPCVDTQPQFVRRWMKSGIIS